MLPFFLFADPVPEVRPAAPVPSASSLAPTSPADPSPSAPTPAPDSPGPAPPAGAASPSLATSAQGGAVVANPSADRVNASTNEPPSPIARRSSRARERGPSTWFARLSLGMAFVPSTDETEALGKDGYKLDTGVRLQFDAAGRVYGPIALGGWVAYTAASAAAADDLDELHRHVVLGGIEAPLVFDAGLATFTLAPRLGLAHGALYFNESFARTVAVYGAEAAFYFRPAHVGLGLGYEAAPVGAVGVARHDDLGGAYFVISGVFND